MGERKKMLRVFHPDERDEIPATLFGVIPGERGDGTTHKTSPPSGCFPLQETVAAFLILACPELVEG